MKKKILIGAVALLLIGAIIGGLLWFKKKKGAPAPTTGAASSSGTGQTTAQTVTVGGLTITIVPGSNLDSRTARADVLAQMPADWSDMGYLTRNPDVYEWLKGGANSTPLEHYLVAGKPEGRTYK